MLWKAVYHFRVYYISWRSQESETNNAQNRITFYFRNKELQMFVTIHW